MLPYIAAILLATSGLGVALDMIAGEKERCILEPLLSTGADRNSIPVSYTHLNGGSILFHPV